MSQSVVVCPKKSLPRDLDVEVVISRPLTEVATDMTLACFLTPDVAFPPNNNRVRFYSTFASLQEDTTVGSAMYWAGKAFFDRSIRPLTLAVGKVYDSPVPAGLIAGDMDFTALNAITDGAFSVEINGATAQVTELNFSTAETIADLVTVLAAKMSGVTVRAKYSSLAIDTVVSGADAELSYATTPSSGTDVSALLGLTKDTGAQLWQGYAPEGLAAEAALVRQASVCNSRPIYGWVLDAKYRDTPDQKAFADWAESLTPSYFSACSNSATAYNTADTTNIGWYAYNKGYKRTSTIYHDNAQVYPDMSYIAFALATNYSLPDSAITMKFKQLDGIEPSPITETQLSALNSRNINSYVFIGNTARTVREGTQALDTWYTDTLVNLDNFREELQVEVYNVFLRNGKVPYTAAGQNKLVSAAAKICRKYTRNGVFADRDVEDEKLESGFTTLPATNIEPVPVAFATTSERASRVAPPILITAYESGAFHKVSLRVDVYN